MKKKIAIVGGGFAGLKLVTRLSGNRNFEEIVVDSNKCHFLPPLLKHPISASLTEGCFKAKKISAFTWGQPVSVVPRSKPLKRTRDV